MCSAQQCGMPLFVHERKEDFGMPSIDLRTKCQLLPVRASPLRQHVPDKAGFICLCGRQQFIAAVSAGGTAAGSTQPCKLRSIVSADIAGLALPRAPLVQPEAPCSAHSSISVHGACKQS